MVSPQSKSRINFRVIGFFAAVGFAAVASAFSLQDLRDDKKLTPENFNKRFAKFKFEFAAPVQSPEEFIARKTGDCDDYATLAAAELAARGYTPKLIAVRMRKEIHVVCYVKEANGYLDYNYRAKRSGLVRCRAEMEEIADSVSKYFKAPWTSASEFTFSDGMKRMVSTVRAQKIASNNSIAQ